MKAGQGKNKGGQFEREMCEKLSRWLTNGDRKDLLCRTVSSGGQFTTGRKKGEYIGLAGDLRAQDPLAFAFCNKFVIECKHWNRLHLQDFFLGSGDLLKALIKVQDEANYLNKQWMLIAKENYKDTLVFMSSLQYHFSQFPAFPFSYVNGPKLITFGRLEEFLKDCSPQQLIS